MNIELQMEKTFWERIQNLKESINGGAEPMETIEFQTTTVRWALGVYLTQSLVIAMWWSIKDAVFYPWFFFIGSFLQVGWVWNKVTSYWLYAQGYRLVQQSPEEDEYSDSMESSIHAPAINLQNTGIIDIRE